MCSASYICSRTVFSILSKKNQEMRLNSLLLGVSLTAMASLPAIAQTAGGGKVTASPTATVSHERSRPQPTMTLREALIAVYQTNPQLERERANQRATDEGVPIARASGLPSANGSIGYTQNLYNSQVNPLSPARRGSLGLDLAVPVYNGGSVRNSIRAAETRVEAGQANLRGAEAEIFTQAVTAYVDVLRDESIVNLNRQNVNVLRVNLQATRDRFEVGDLTRTDVAQSEARLALAEGQLRGVEARLIGSRETFIRVIGQAPGVLAAPPPLPNLPDDVVVAEDVALGSNPNIEAAKIALEATGYDVKSARGTRLPQVSLTSTGNYFNNLNSVRNPMGLMQEGISSTIGANVRVPLFQGGLPAARVRQAQARQSSAMETVTLTERGTIAMTRTAFANYQSALGVIEASKVAVSANRLSLEGVRAENSVGTRTILEILNAEQELLNSQVNYVSAERDAYVAGFMLLSAMGKAEAKDLGLDGGPLYDPVANYKKVRGNMWDWADSEAPIPVGTSTRHVPAQTPNVETGLPPVLQRSVDIERQNP